MLYQNAHVIEITPFHNTCLIKHWILSSAYIDFFDLFYQKQIKKAVH